MLENLDYTLLYTGVLVIFFILVAISLMLHREKLLISKQNITLKNEIDNAQNYFDIAGTMILVLDKDNHVIKINRRGCEIMGYRADEMLGKNWIENFLPIRYRTKVMDVSSDVQKIPNSYSEFTNPVLTKEGTEKIIFWRNTSLVDENGLAIGVVTSGEDISQKLENEMLLLTSMRQAQMGEMISIIAHQWSQPLTIVNSISAHIRIKELTKKDSNELLMENMTEIEKQVVYLSQTITDFKDFFRPDRPKELVQTSQIIHNAVNLIDYAIKNNGVSIEEIILQDSELFIFSNELLQIILTLLKNSIDAFTDNNIVEGKIVITIDKTDTYNTIMFKDNAGGIPSNIIEKIFQPYFTTKSDRNGTGLGLSMCKMIIEDHLNGSITVVSEDQYTTFTINLSTEEESL
jgi:PAS domain S-box-containing protein